MSTDNIEISSTVWTEVAPAASKGLLSNLLNSRIYIREGVAVPDSSIGNGHPLDSGISANIDLSSSGNSLYARAIINEPIMEVCYTNY